MKKLVVIAMLAGNLMLAGTVNYSYDAAGRLVKIDYGSGGFIAYTYDSAGNILTRTQVSAATVAAQAAKAKAPSPVGQGKGQPDKQVRK